MSIKSSLTHSFPPPLGSRNRIFLFFRQGTFLSTKRRVVCFPPKLLGRVISLLVPETPYIPPGANLLEETKPPSNRGTSRAGQLRGASALGPQLSALEDLTTGKILPLPLSPWPGLLTMVLSYHAPFLFEPRLSPCSLLFFHLPTPQFPL